MINSNDPHRRVGDNSPARRVTGYHDLRALVTNVLVGLAIAGIVGGLTVWKTQAVMTKELEAMAARVEASQARQTEEIGDLRDQMRQFQRDFYPPRYGRDQLVPPP